MKLQTGLIALGSVVIVLLPALRLVVSSTLLSFMIGGPDSWAHYSGGGMFVTASPSLSGDEDQIVFSTPASGHGDIYVADLHAGSARQLTHGDDCELSPHFLPNTRTIVFQRERIPNCHIWLLDLQTGIERELTHGEFWDTILSVSPNGKSMLINRSTLASGRVVKIHLLDIATGAINELKDISIAKFTEGGSALLTTVLRGVQGVLHGDFRRTSLKGEPGMALGDGEVQDVCDASSLVVYAKIQQPLFDPIRYDLCCYDLVSGKHEDIGAGHSPCIFANGKVLYFVGYEHQAMIWQKGKFPRKIDSPPGYKVHPNRSDSEKSAAFFVMPPNQQDRQYDTYLFDSEAERFAQLKFKLPTVDDDK